MDQNRVVISLHGIRTRGVWQKDLVPELAKDGFIPYVLDYGYFNVFQLMRSSSLDKQVNWLTGQYDRIRAETGCKRPSVIAHSFGTLQVARMLEMHRHVVFDKIILAASIVRCDFPWAQMLSESRAKWVVNDYGGKDIWPRFAGWAVPNAGNSGSVGFLSKHRALRQVEHPHHGHSDYFSLGNFRYNWIPTLLLQKRKIVDDLHGLIGMLSKDLGVDRKQLRCFVFAEDPDTECLKVVPGLQVGEINEAETRMAISMDAIGIEAAPTIAFKQMREVRQNRQDLVELGDSLGSGSPFNRNVAWSISVPLPYGTDTSRAIGVLIVDALISVPEVADADLSEAEEDKAESTTETVVEQEAHESRGVGVESGDGVDQLPQSGYEDLASFSLANELLEMDNVSEVVLRLGISLCRARNESRESQL
ncbi:hypothetical protein GTP91_18385 [Rugamonas sp. FT82W]|uniref:Alpha/beta hydrolase n=1 Tax=Duganella vulcania TaxID=2692166 RepID=A0A845G5K0_9BURK|nr:alpha/beta hydrolase [Duganella vulcania]MYM89131.1 hypothetical protein [Duganella vulcania]